MNQAGLSWLTILKKRDNFRAAYSQFNIAKVAKYGDREIARLMNDPGIIRNKLKVEAAIENARRVQGIQREHGSFAKWIDAQHPLTKDEWVKLFKQTFRFTGCEITGEFLMSIGYLPGAHHEKCPIYSKIAKKKPKWMQAPLPKKAKAVRG
jgi:DNA-3-methyladenine glycosylase I